MVQKIIQHCKERRREEDALQLDLNLGRSDTVGDDSFSPNTTPRPHSTNRENKIELLAFTQKFASLSGTTSATYANILTQTAPTSLFASQHLQT